MYQQQLPYPSSAGQPPRLELPGKTWTGRKMKKIMQLASCPTAQILRSGGLSSKPTAASYLPEAWHWDTTFLGIFWNTKQAFIFQSVSLRKKCMGECNAPGIQQRISKIKTKISTPCTFWKMAMGNQMERQVLTFWKNSWPPLSKVRPPPPYPPFMGREQNSLSLAPGMEKRKLNFWVSTFSFLRSIPKMVWGWRSKKPCVDCNMRRVICSVNCLIATGSNKHYN